MSDDGLPSDDFLLFQWDVDTTDDTDANCNNKDKPIDILEELSRLSDEASGYTSCGGSDLHSVVKLIGSSFPYEQPQTDGDRSVEF